MKPFFTREDFIHSSYFKDGSYGLNETFWEYVVRLTNNKLEREGIKLTGIMTDKYTGHPMFIWNDSTAATHKALLINIEPVDIKCTHPPEKVNTAFSISVSDEIEAYYCDCGVKVKPKTFEVVE